jgi:hypothetical protein
MNELPRKTLRLILAKHGREIAGNAERCRGLLNDLCGGYRREINILVTAIEERVPLDLLAAARSMPTNLLLARLEKRLADQTGLTAEAARWAVGSWALALGSATDSEIAERESKPTHNPTTETANIQLTGDEKKPANQKAAEIKPFDEKTPSPSPTKQPPAAPPLSRRPANMPPVHLPPNNQPPAQPKIQPTGTPPYPHAPQTRSWLFRGCLIFVLALIVSFGVLLFGVPYALEKMRETQRDRQNEPPRFPVR